MTRAMFKKDAVGGMDTNVKLKSLRPGMNDDVFDTLYKANAYEISVRNLITIFKHFQIKESLSYTALQSLKLNPLKLYIENENLDLFIGEVLNMFYGEEPTDRWKEDKKSVVHLLNLKEEQLNSASKKILIKRADFDKIDFSEISEKTLWEPLCVSKKVNSKWKNLRDYFIQKDNKEISEDSGLLVLVNDASWIKDLPQLENDSATITKYAALITSLLYFEFEKPIGLKRFLKKLDFLLDQENINENSNPVNIRTVIDEGYFVKTLEVYKKLKEEALTDILHLEYAKKVQDLLLNDDSLFEFSAEELTYILNENFKLDFKYKALLRNPNHIQGLDGKTVTKAFDVILKKGDFLSFELMKQLMSAVAMENQIKLFNQIYKEKDELGYKVTDLMHLFKGELENISKIWEGIEMPRNEDNHQFTLNLQSMGLVTTYKPDDDIVKFRRNTKEVSDI